MDGKRELDIGSGGVEESAVSVSPGTAVSFIPSPRRRKQGTPQTSPVEALEIFQSAFNDLQRVGIPALGLKAHDGQTLVYKIGARLCPLCKQPRPLWHFIGNICQECQK